MQQQNNLITAEGLTKYYGDKMAVNEIDFSIRQGECYGFLGPNGAGKTSVMKILYCFMPPSSGKTRVLDMDVNEHPSEIKARLGVMPQDDNLDPDLNCIENLIVYARYFDIRPEISKPRGLELMSFLSLSEQAEINVQKLSGGMRRRLLLARCLINDPDIIILDEPTTGMDPHGRIDVWSALSALKQEGKTLLLTTHYMEEAERICDRVAIMDQGRIVTVDSPENLMKEHDGDLEHVYLKLTGSRLEY